MDRKELEQAVLEKLDQNDFAGASELLKGMGDEVTGLRNLITARWSHAKKNEAMEKLHEYLENQSSADAKLQKSIDTERREFAQKESILKQNPSTSMRPIAISAELGAVGDDDGAIDDLFIKLFTKLDRARILKLSEFLHEALETVNHDRAYVAGRSWTIETDAKGLLGFALQFAEVYGKRRTGRAILVLSDLIQDEDKRIEKLGWEGRK